MIRGTGDPSPGARGRRALLVLISLVLASGCGLRQRLDGREARDARGFFEASSAVAYPYRASWSVVAKVSGRSVPLVLGVNADAADRETVGLYDPLGRELLLAGRSGGRAVLSRGEDAGTLDDPELRALLPSGKSLALGDFSMSRVLAGGVGFPVGEGRAATLRDGSWEWSDGRQAILSDPGRRFLARAEYDISGVRLAVAYPGRESPAAPRVVTIETRGAQIVLRRDAE